ncbi:MAG: prephenate dehydrogenase/arogenate dehydrogenase family protein, partial [Actinomycetota bacterium]|nr:prephenate dehydrogenase/arogenate dehydrogenase family protein [Actinomycetota bacterium]
MGGSLALAARGVAGVERIVVTDRDREVRREAARRGLGEVGTEPAAVAAGSDVVFIAVPLEEIPKVAASIWSVMQPSAVLTDVGSVKSNVMAEVE